MKYLFRLVNVITLLLLTVPLFAEEQSVSTVNTGDTAWVITSAALVLLMTVPALALFYGGMVRRKNVLSTLFYSFSAAIIVSILWVIGMYSSAFSVTSADPASVSGLGEWIGSVKHWFFSGVTSSSIHPNAPTVPENVFSMFQLMFAIITVALISGAIVERMSFIGWFVFTILWSIIVYTPLAHWVWNPEGFLWHKGALDFAGGLVVHTSSGISALVLAIVLGPRIGFRKDPVQPASPAYVFIGAAMLWVGWMGFNAGSAVGANGLAGSAFVVTNTAAAVAALTWMVLEWIVVKKATLIGASTGLVAGLVAITPGSGFVDVPSAMAIGALVSIVSFIFMNVIRKLFRYDDALDVFSVHGMGGIIGALVTGIFANPAVNPLGKGLLYGNPGQLGTQLLSVVLAIIISVAGTLVCIGLTQLITLGNMRVRQNEEIQGLDMSQHGEILESK